jgi:hypothetical protein
MHIRHNDHEQGHGFGHKDDVVANAMVLCLNAFFWEVAGCFER